MTAINGDNSSSSETRILDLYPDGEHPRHFHIGVPPPPPGLKHPPSKAVRLKGVKLVIFER